VDMHATDLVGINGITRVLLVYTCQQGVYDEIVYIVTCVRFPWLNNVSTATTMGQ
jgi:hypothetical protein